MKLMTYQYDGRTRIGVVVEGAVVDVTAVAPDMISLIELGGGGLAQARQLAVAAANPIPLAEVKLLAPIPVPRRNVMCLGWNYAEHAAESAATKGLSIKELPQFPIIFTKATTSVTGPYDDIPFDAAVSTHIDWEAEMAVIIGQPGKNIPRAQAMRHVFGYTVLNDLSARDLQRNHKQFFKGKSLDGHCPIGPWIVTADELPNPHHLPISCRVNGQIKQESNTAHMIFNIPEIIAQLSRGMTLLPGDIIATGTPSGVGFARTPPQYLQPGDVVACEVAGIGRIRNQIG